MDHSLDNTVIAPGSSISVLGPHGAFSEMAANMVLGDRVDVHDVDVQLKSSMHEVRRSVSENTLGLIPDVNYSTGPEDDNRRALFKKPWRIRAELYMRIVMCLGAQGNLDLSEAAAVHSKDVAIKQCEDYLEQHCPQAHWQNEASTAEAARIVAELDEPNHLALASEGALTKNGLTVLKTGGISNAELNGSANVTRFLLVQDATSEDPELDPDSKYHGLVITPKDRKGVSADVSRAFADNGMNLFAQPEMPIGMLKYRFLYLFERIDSDADVMALLQELDRLLEPANGRYPLIKSLGSWNDRIIDPTIS